MSTSCVRDVTKGGGVILAEAVRLIDGLDAERKPCLKAVEVYVLGEDGLERTLVLPYEPATLKSVPVKALAARLGVHEDAIQV